MSSTLYILLNKLCPQVVTDNNGVTKGFGFVRFSNEMDARKAISDFNLSPGLGTRRIRVCKAFPKQ